MAGMSPEQCRPFFADRIVEEEPLATEEASKEPEKVWEDCNLLTFDGGGTRGFWSLLVMKQLMDHICAIEMVRGVLHSFDPLQYPMEVSQLPFTREEERKLRMYPENQVQALDPARRYIPAHYFDYIGGTSTGALIAIMLGRFRMTVLDCMYEYENMGGQIFGRSSLLRSMSMLWSGTKHSTDSAEDAFRKVVARRGEVVSRGTVGVRFPSRKWMCQTFATTLLAIGIGVNTDPFVLRSYESPARTSKLNQQKLLSKTKTKRTRFTTIDSTGLNHSDEGSSQSSETEEKEKAHDLEVYQVARAATAVPKVFRPQKVLSARGEEMFFEDAALRVPNPVGEGIREIRHRHGSDSLGVVVSVSTAKPEHIQLKELGKEHLLSTARRLAANATSPKNAHREAEKDCNDNDIPYYRFHPSASEFRLSPILDEWQPRKATGGQTAGSRTLRDMEQKFNRWYTSSPEVRRMFQRCADELVQRRLRRAADRAKWERYVTGSYFKCPEKHCKQKNRAFTFQDEFLQHCRDRPDTHPSTQALSNEQLLRNTKHEAWRYQSRVERSVLRR